MSKNQWWELYDQSTDKNYYYNGLTGETVWVKPMDNADIIPLTKLQVMDRLSTGAWFMYLQLLALWHMHVFMHVHEACTIYSEQTYNLKGLQSVAVVSKVKPQTLIINGIIIVLTIARAHSAASD